MDVKRLFEGSWNRIKNLKKWVFLLILINISFFLIGYGMVEVGLPYVLEFREKQLKEIPSLPYIQPLLGPLSPYLSLKIIYTFLFNLTVGAFISTTLTGIVFLFPVIITIYRAWFVGIVFHGFLSSPVFILLFLGTFILEFGAYTISALAGINIGLSLMFPQRFYGSGRKEAFLFSLKDGAYLYIMVIFLLFLGAVWEMTWTHILGFSGGSRGLVGDSFLLD